MVLRQQLENLHLDPQEQGRKRANWEWGGAFKTSMLSPGHPPPNPSQTVTSWGPSVQLCESVETIIIQTTAAGNAAQRTRRWVHSSALGDMRKKGMFISFFSLSNLSAGNAMFLFNKDKIWNLGNKPKHSKQEKSSQLESYCWGLVRCKNENCENY